MISSIYLIDELKKIASSINITNPEAHRFFFGEGLGGRMITNPREFLEEVVNRANTTQNTNKFTVEATVKELNDMQSGLGNRLNSKKPTAVYSGKEPIRKVQEKIFQAPLQKRREMGFPVSPAGERRARKINRFIGLPTPAEGSRMFKTHEMSHLESFKKNPKARVFSTKEGDKGLRRLGSLIKEEGRAYKDELLKTPMLRKRTRALRSLSIPKDLVGSVRHGSGGIRSEISKGTIGRLAKQILRKGK